MLLNLNHIHVIAGSILLLAQLAASSALPVAPDGGSLEARNSPNGRCGASFGGYNCNADGGIYRCCSQYGWCGDSSDHCGTGCQAAYGSCGTGGGSTPTPTPPPSGSRSRLGSVPYGVSLYSCTVPGTIALTYDDGPYVYTNELLDILANRGVKATFFVTGNNLGKGAIDDPANPWAAIIRRAYNEGHQIAAHTWDHPDLNTLTDAQRRYQMQRLEQALMTIIGRYPTYMRPPYISCSGSCLTTMNELGYHVIIWDLNTDDYNNVTPQLIQNARNNVYNAVQGTNPANRNFMSIAHDIHEQTVIGLTNYQIDVGVSNGYRHVTLGECFGDSPSNWYRTQL